MSAARHIPEFAATMMRVTPTPETNEKAAILAALRLLQAREQGSRRVDPLDPWTMSARKESLRGSPWQRQAAGWLGSDEGSGEW